MALKAMVFIDGAWLYRSRTTVFAKLGEENFEVDYARLPRLLCEELAQVVFLGTVDTLIVYHRQGVEFLAQCLKLCHTRSIAEWRQLAQVHILRMQGEDADT